MKKKNVSLKNYLSYLCVVISLIYWNNDSYSQDFHLKVKIANLKDSSVILGHYYGKNFLVNDTIYLNEKGEGELKRKEKLPVGVYFLYLLGKTKFDFILDNDQIFEIITDTVDFYKNMTINGSQENEVFLRHTLFMEIQAKKMQTLNKKIADNTENPLVLDTLIEESKKINKEIEDHWDTIVHKHPNHFFSQLMKSMRPVKLPDFEIDENITNKDSAKYVYAYRYNKDHYWDNIDLTDERLLATPLLEEKLNNFINKSILQIPDSINKESDILIAKAQGNKNIYRYIVQYIFNNAIQSKVMGMEAVTIHIAENYYLNGKTPWATKELLDKIREDVEKRKPNLIGGVAPELKLQTLDGHIIKLSETDANYILIYFWDPTCGHCKETTPKLYKKIYPEIQKYGVKIFSIYTQGDKELWGKFINEHEMFDWINAWDPHRESNFRSKYNVYTTPTIYLLDENKKIIAKQIDIEQIEQIIKRFDTIKK